MSIALDLDALAPKDVDILFKGKTISVQPPDFEAYAKISEVGVEMNNLDGETDIAKISPVYQKAVDMIKELIPELAEEKLNFAQVLSLYKFLAELAAPKDDATMEALKEHGVDLKSEDSSPKE